MEKSNYVEMMAKIRMASNAQLIAYRSHASDLLRSPLSAEPTFKSTAKKMIDKINEELDVRYEVSALDASRKSRAK